MNHQVFVLMVHIPDQSESDWMHEANPKIAGGAAQSPPISSSTCWTLSIVYAGSRELKCQVSSNGK
jgi:hypothetical protein